ncbi:hypothetical protein Y032_0005g2307 [Ancylostoma ceylanicum]|nr:hypothetical protein Y032_0005g2307 [Ancylostoma ceylanicum]
MNTRIYSCSSKLEDCAEIIGLSSDDNTGEIHFLAQFPNGTVALYELNQEDRTPRLLSTSTDLPPIRHLLVSNEKVIFVTNRGRIGQCDKKLGSLNVNYAVVDVNTVIALRPVTTSNRVEIQSESIAMGDLKKDELSWIVDPRKDPGAVLYKISLYKDKLFVGDAHTAITTLTKLTLPPELLQSWSSAQRFDANIAARHTSCGPPCIYIVMSHNATLRKELWRDLNNLLYGLNLLPKRKIGESSMGVAPHIRCTFCGQNGLHYSDSCPHITDGDDRWFFVREQGLCPHCLERCDPRRECWSKKKKCWYCSVVENTILRFLIPNDGGHHRALCNIPNSEGKIRERVQEIKRQLSNR